MAEGCPSEELLAAYIDGVATPKEIELVDAHLNGCHQCLELVAAVILSRIAIPDPVLPDPDQSM